MTCIFHASVLNSSHSSVKIDPSYMYVSKKKVLKLYGEPGDVAEISLTNTDFQPITVSILLKVKLNQCPPGFVIKRSSNEEDSLKCICSANAGDKSYTGIHRCNSEKKRAYIEYGYWVGYYNNASEQQLVTGHCPRGFCNFSGKSSGSYLPIEYELPSNASKTHLDKYVCTSSRTGKLCGSCRRNYSIHFHSSFQHCQLNSHRCQFGPLLYMLSELLPVTVLFAIVIFCNIKFTSGAVNTFIFFAQIMETMHTDAGGLIKEYPHIEAFTSVYQLFYKMFNLEFFSLDNLSFCLMKTATTLDILSLKYLTITYSLLLVLTTVAVMKLCNPCRLKKYFVFSSSTQSVKQSVIHGLIATLVMCYSQCTAVSLLILTPGYIYWKGPIEKRNVTTVVYLQGDLPFFGKEHLKYAVPAILFTVFFVITPPVILIVYPLCYRVFVLCHIEEALITQVLCKLAPLEKIKPFFDSVQGCFKDEYRFFGGLYFLYRLTSLICYVASYWHTDFYVLLEIQLVVMVAVHAGIQPYRQRWHNALDISLLTLLAVINALTMYSYFTLFRHGGRQTVINAVSSIQTILAYLPIIYMVIYISVKVVNGVRRKYLKPTDHSGCQVELEDTLTFVDNRMLDLEYKRVN